MAIAPSTLQPRSLLDTEEKPATAPAGSVPTVGNPPTAPAPVPAPPPAILPAPQAPAPVAAPVPSAPSLDPYVNGAMSAPSPTPPIVAAAPGEGIITEAMQPTPPAPVASVQATSLAPTPPLVLSPSPAAERVSLSPFTAQDNLRAFQVNPTASQGLLDAQGMTNRAAAGVSSYDGLGPFDGVGANGDPRTADADASLESVRALLASIGMGNPQQIEGTDLSGANATLGSAEQAASGARLGTGYDRMGAGSYDPSAESAAARAASLHALEALSGTPSRSDLAMRSFNLLRDGTQEQYDRDLGATTGRMAAMGRIGDAHDDSLQRLYRARESDMDRAREDLSLRAAGDEMSDRQGRLNSTLGAFSAFGGEDRADAATRLGMRNEARGERDFWSGLDSSRAGMDLARANTLSSLAGQRAGFAGVARNDAENDRSYNTDFAARRAGLDMSRADALSGLSNTQFARGSALRSEARGERDAGTSHRLADLNARRGVLDSMSGFEGQRYGEDAATRGEYRTERGYQNDLAQQAIDNEMRRAQLQDALLGSAYGRDTDLTKLLMEMGYGGTNPSATMLAASGQTEPDNAGITDMAQLLAYRRAQQQGGTPAPPARVPAGAGTSGVTDPYTLSLMGLGGY